MLRKYSTHRTHEDNMKLGSLTAFSAGMTNVVALIVFFSFVSNVTGHYAILAQELAKGNWYQAAVVLMWVMLFFLGSFVSNFVIIHGRGKMDPYVSHAIPLALEILCMFVVGLYLDLRYASSLIETEFLIGALLFAMGLQNGLTATISNFAVKTTHLTGLTTDLGILTSMFTKSANRKNQDLVNKFNLLLAILAFYLLGGLLAGGLYIYIQYKTFYMVCVVLLVIALYDRYKLMKIKKDFSNRHEKKDENYTDDDKKLLN